MSFRAAFFLRFGLFFALLFVWDVAIAEQVFWRTLRIGSEGEDVLRLQEFLNEDPATVVSLSGPGSAGAETMYFGILTKRAVERFQQKFADEVLRPAGLSFPTGVVGPRTRRKLEELLSRRAIPSRTSSVPAPLPVSVTPLFTEELEPADIHATDRAIKNFQTRMDKEAAAAIAAGRGLSVDPNELFAPIGRVLLFYPSRYSGAAGTPLDLYGNGFTEGNTVFFGERFSLKGVSSSGERIHIAVPEVPPGRYDIAVKNQRGLSNTTFFVVRGENAPEVRVVGITPTSVRFGEEVTVSGEGFTKEGNELRTSYGTIDNVPSPDGKTIRFRVEPEIVRDAVGQGRIYGTTLQVVVYVVNDNGLSQEPIFFSLSL